MIVIEAEKKLCSCDVWRKYRKTFNISYSSLEAISSWSRETNTPLKSASIFFPRDNHFLDIADGIQWIKFYFIVQLYIKIYQKKLYQKNIHRNIKFTIFNFRKINIIHIKVWIYLGLIKICFTNKCKIYVHTFRTNVFFWINNSLYILYLNLLKHKKNILY